MVSPSPQNTEPHRKDRDARDRTRFCISSLVVHRLVRIKLEFTEDALLRSNRRWTRLSMLKKRGLQESGDEGFLFSLVPKITLSS